MILSILLARTVFGKHVYATGGNRSAAGAQIPNCSLRDAVNRLFAAIDEYCATD